MTKFHFYFLFLPAASVIFRFLRTLDKTFLVAFVPFTFLHIKRACLHCSLGDPLKLVSVSVIWSWSSPSCSAIFCQFCKAIDWSVTILNAFLIFSSKIKHIRFSSEVLQATWLSKHWVNSFWDLATIFFFYLKHDLQQHGF